MPSFDFTLLTIVGCGIATWLSRAVPFALLKKFDLPAPLLEYLGFVPIVIMSALWFNSLLSRFRSFTSNKYGNLLALSDDPRCDTF